MTTSGSRPRSEARESSIVSSRMHSSGILEVVSLTECNSQRATELLTESKISDPEAVKSKTVLSGNCSGGELSLKLKRSIMDGEVRPTPANFTEVLDIYTHAMAVCRLVKLCRRVK